MKLENAGKSGWFVQELSVRVSKKNYFASQSDIIGLNSTLLYNAGCEGVSTQCQCHLSPGRRCNRSIWLTTQRFFKRPLMSKLIFFSPPV